MDNTALKQAAPKVFIVTIHGTWSRGAPWARQGSVLGQALVRWFAANGCDANVEPFEWSGRNSINARRHAGVHLALLLERIRQRDRSAEIYVVAHSHGGSVFAYAMKHQPALLPAVNGFVALATPWIGARPTSYAIPFRMMMTRMAAFGTLLASLVPLSLLIDYLVFLNFHPAGGAYGWAGDIGRILVLGIAADMYTAAAAACFALAGFLLWRFWLSTGLQKGAKAFHERLAAWAECANTLDAGLPVNSVFLKPAGDEAAMALGWTSAMAAIAQGTSALLFWILQAVRDLWMRVPSWGQLIAGGWLSVGLLSGSYLVLADWMTWGDEKSLSALLRRLVADLSPADDSVTGNMLFLTIAALEWQSLVIWAISCVFAGTMLLLLVVSLVAAAGAGVITPSALFLEFWVEAVPAGDHRLVLVEVRQDSTDINRVAPAPLSHSALYSNAVAIEAVICALARFRSKR